MAEMGEQRPQGLCQQRYANSSRRTARIKGGGLEGRGIFSQNPPKGRKKKNGEKESGRFYRQVLRAELKLTIRRR